jgi:hypothetical protein
VRRWRRTGRRWHRHLRPSVSRVRLRLRRAVERPVCRVYGALRCGPNGTASCGRAGASSIALRASACTLPKTSLTAAWPAVISL